MTYDNFTTKSQEAIQKAQQIAGSLDQQQVGTAHLVRGILEIEEDVATFLFSKCGVSMTTLRKGLEKSIGATPKVKGTEKQYLTKPANKALSRAKKLLPDFGDEYISIELMLMGIALGDDETGKLLQAEGATEEALRAAIEELRKGRKGNPPRAPYPEPT